ncbi:sigma-54 interaction domain-containing protein [Pseudomonas fluorescens]
MRKTEQPVGKQFWLVCWIGNTDLKCARNEARTGPIAMAVEGAGHYDRVLLLSDYPERDGRHYQAWLEKLEGCPPVEVCNVELASPIDYGEIFERVCEVFEEQRLPRTDVTLTYHLSPGTPAMAAIWIILAKTRFPASLIQSSPQQGLTAVDFPIGLSSAFLIDFMQQTSAGVNRFTGHTGIIGDCTALTRQIRRAQRVAAFDVPVLVLGETGTGKELFAKAIHEQSARKGKPFVAVNCGAISVEMANSELFGHVKGAFTGAIEPRDGHFREAAGGTLFLDEIGDLPLDAQVRLLRVLQEKEITPLGASKPVKVDVRIIAATHRELAKDVQAGRFREDLYHRIAVGILNLPPLRERGTDLELLIDHFLDKAHVECSLGHEVRRTLTDDARQTLLHYPWPGNIRELSHTLVRAYLWSNGSTVTKEDICEALMEAPAVGHPVLDRPLRDGLELKAILNEVSVHYINRAMAETSGRKGDTAKLLGFTNHQTLGNWMRRLGLESISGGDLKQD